MEPYQQRVVDEKKELDLKLEKLEQFLSRDPSLSMKEHELLESQANAMSKYSEILKQRIELFK